MKRRSMIGLIILTVCCTNILPAQGLQFGHHFKKAVDFTGIATFPPLMFKVGGIENADVPYFSYFMPRIDVEGGIISRRYDTSHYTVTLGYQMVNVPLKTIIIHAYKNEFGDNQTNRIIVEAKHPEKFWCPNGEDYKQWAQVNTWCYDIQVPASKATRLDSIIREDFERAFDVKLGIEKRKMPCLALVKKGKIPPAKTIENGYVKSIKGKGMEIRGAKTEVLIYLFKQANESIVTPIVNETNYAGAIDIDLTAKLHLGPDNIQAVKENLNRYGLDLVFKDILIDMLVIKDVSAHQGK